MVVRRAPEQGMTLVELMVTMVIASIVAASTFMFFAGQQRVYETQTKMLNVQQNAWAAMEVLTRFVRASGSGMYGCVRPVGGIVPALPLKRTPDATPDDSDDPPALPNVNSLSPRPNAGLRASFQGGNMQRIPPLWIVDQANDPNAVGIKSQTDVITVAFGNRTSGTTCDASLNAAVNVNNVPSAITASPSGSGTMFQANEFILLVNNPSSASGFLSDIGCTLFQISSVSSDTLLLASTKPWNPGSNVSNLIPFTYTAGAPNACDPAGAAVSNAGIRNLGEFWWVQFAVRTTDQNGNYLSNQGIPVLTMQRLDGSVPNSPQILAEGIEDLQVAFACELNADGLLSEGQGAARATDEWMLNSPNDVAMNRAAKCNQPSAIRLTLVARSLTEDNGIDANANFNGPPTVENHVRATCCGDPSDPSTTKPATCCDQYRRRVLSTTVYPRNN